MSALTVAERPRRIRGPAAWWKDPWRKPHILAATTVGYLLWSTVPVIIAVIFSFNSGRSRSTWQGFSLRWWTQDPYDSVLHSTELRAAMLQTFKLSFATVLIAVPLGTLFAIGIDRWHGRPARGSNFTMLLSFVMPEIILGVALFLFFTKTLSNIVPLGTGAQILGLVTYQISYPVIICRARLLTIGAEYEEAAMDLGAAPGQAIRRVLLPLLAPAIMASVALVFADTVDDFVTVNYLFGSSDTRPLSVLIYSAARSSPTPAVNAAATVMLVSTVTMIIVGYVLYKWFNRGQEGETSSVSFAQL